MNLMVEVIWQVSLLCEGKESRIFGLGEKKEQKDYMSLSRQPVQLLIVYLSDERIWLINKNDSPY